jgi:hypothetical protein
MYSIWPLLSVEINQLLADFGLLSQELQVVFCLEPRDPLRHYEGKTGEISSISLAGSGPAFQKV